MEKYFHRLKDFRDNIKSFMEEQHTRLNTLNWETEFEEYDCNSEYTIIRLPEWHDEFYVAVIEIRKTLNMDTYDLRDYLLETEQRYIEISKIQRERLKQEYFKRDIDILPSLFCKSCGRFFSKVQTHYDHDCKGKTTCENCGKNCRTKDRLNLHIESRMCFKKYNCEQCIFQSNSHNEFERHNKSKSHKEKCGIKKIDIFYNCDQCDKTYAFPSELKRHKLSHLNKN